MSTFADIDAAVEVFRRANCPFTLLHCVSTYPCPDEDCNMKVVQVLKERYGCPVGYSSHDIGLLPSIVAVTLGATVIEKHITLDRAMYGSDQSASLEKRGLHLLVRECRAVDAIIGSGIKEVSKAEQDIASKLRYFREP
jgi:N-acetylneuraminate synthase